MLSITSRKFIT